MTIEDSGPRVVSLLCHFSDAVHVVSSNLLRHHTAHCQFQLQQGRSKAVVLGNGNEHSQKSHSHMLGGTTLVLNIELDNGQVASERSTDKNNDFAFTQLHLDAPASSHTY